MHFNLLAIPIKKVENAMRDIKQLNSKPGKAVEWLMECRGPSEMRMDTKEERPVISAGPGMEHEISPPLNFGPSNKKSMNCENWGIVVFDVFRAR
eukprot:7104871-Lingulodinium_polyedra.AAC.1